MLITPAASVVSAPEKLDFVVLPEAHDAFSNAAALGAANAHAWMAQHPDANEAEFSEYVLGSLKAPASDDADLPLTRAAIASRDAAHDAQASWLDGNGVFDAWKGSYAEFGADLSGEQAAEGTVLIKRAQGLALDISMRAKDVFRRDRPKVNHPEFHLSPGINNAIGYSFPSGHGAHSFATAAVLAAVDPQLAVPAAALAEQISYSRVYAAAHFVSDLAAGAYIGGAVGAYVTRH